ncbi:MAG: DUF2510 domain-containing protein [Gordonia sp. (in: high G+C Gram-positive bacteria)]
MNQGWYDDGSGTMRWWDGQKWTERTQPPAQQAPHAQPQQAPHAQPQQQVPNQRGGLGGMIDRIEADANAGAQPRVASQGMSYVVLQVILKEKLWGTGSGNLTELEAAINQQAALGYRLHTISTAASGSKGFGGGDRIQATMVFEKL